jgi:membrane associated rhomboid family serine protease
MAINILAYLIDMVTGGLLTNLGANYGVFTVVRSEYWRLVTASFLHSGIFHIGFNMWILWSLGRLSERLFGKWQTVFIYLLTGVGGALLSIAKDIERIEVGASAAIFGIAGAILLGLKFGNLAISHDEKKAIFSNMVFFVVINFALGSGMFAGVLGGFGARTDNMAHLGGFVTGALLGVPMGGFAQHHKLYQWVTIGITAAFLTLGYKELEKKHGIPQELQQAQSALDRKDIPHAIQYLELYTKNNPDDDRVLIFLGRLYVENNQQQNAVGAFQRALKANPDSAQAKAGLDQLGAGDSQPESK